MLVAPASIAVAAGVETTRGARGGAGSDHSLNPQVFTLGIPSVWSEGSQVLAPLDVPAFQVGPNGGGAGTLAGIPTISPPQGGSSTPFSAANWGPSPAGAAAFRELFRIRTHTPVIPSPASATLAALMLAGLVLRRLPR